MPERKDHSQGIISFCLLTNPTCNWARKLGLVQAELYARKIKKRSINKAFTSSVMME